MAQHRILMANLGYARGINGTLNHHVRHGYRHLWCPPATQYKALKALKQTIHQHQADLCCLLEVDTGSFTSAGINQFTHLLDEEYHIGDVENKYLETSPLRRLPLTAGKSNGFIARRDYAFQKVFFSRGTKRLIYRMQIEPQLSLYFTHFSLDKRIRELQLREFFDLADRAEGEVILMGDFNLLNHGLEEIAPLLSPRPLVLLNDPAVSTFLFHKRQLVLDLCICSKSVADRAKLHIIPQPYSDHAALLLELEER